MTSLQFTVVLIWSGAAFILACLAAEITGHGARVVLLLGAVAFVLVFLLATWVMTQ